MMSENMKNRRVERLHTCMAFGWGVMQCNIKTWILILLLMFIPAKVRGFSIIQPALFAAILPTIFIAKPGTGRSVRTLPVKFDEINRTFWTISVLLVPVAWFIIQVIERICMGEQYTYPIPFLAELALSAIGLASLFYILMVFRLLISVRPSKATESFIACQIVMILYFGSSDYLWRIETWFIPPITWLVLPVSSVLCVYAYVFPRRLMRVRKNREKAAPLKIKQAWGADGLPWRARCLGAWSIPLWTCGCILTNLTVGCLCFLYICSALVRENALLCSLVLFMSFGVAAMFIMHTWGKSVRALRTLPYGPNRLIQFYSMLIAPTACFLVACAIAAYAGGIPTVPFIKSVLAFIVWIPFLYALYFRLGKIRTPFVMLALIACILVPYFAFNLWIATLWLLAGVVGYLYLRHTLIHNSVIYRLPANE